MQAPAWRFREAQAEPCVRLSLPNLLPPSSRRGAGCYGRPAERGNGCGAGWLQGLFWPDKSAPPQWDLWLRLGV